jgi:hypothetical protein
MKRVMDVTIDYATTTTTTTTTTNNNTNATMGHYIM